MPESTSIDNVAQSIAEAEQLFDQNELEAAEAIARRVLEQDSANARGLQVLGMIHARCDRPNEAIPLLDRALAIQPDLASAHNELGMSYDQLGSMHQALVHFERALILQPDHAFAHLNRALWNLKVGRFREGWIEYEWRFMSQLVRRPEIPTPRWDGSSLKGKGLLVHTEQGLGDVIQFARFIPLLKNQGTRIVVACPERLQPLLRLLPGVDQWVPIDTETEVTFEYHTPLMSLAALLGIHQEDDIPNKVPYLYADSARCEKWREALHRLDGYRIGICWQGSPTYLGDTLRSIPLEAFRPIAQLPGVKLISLQKGYGTEQIAAGEFPLTTLEDLDHDGAFLDSAAAMQSLDLIITSDTAVAHLAGALGRPAWVALSTWTDWRWGLDREDSPWYPSLRLFRQPNLGNWSSVFLAMTDALRPVVAHAIRLNSERP
jgi:hypothetical protein